MVGGRAFTSLVMQRNCHEFIAYENLVSSRRFQTDRGQGQKSTPTTTQQAPLDQVVPLVRRALKVLIDREVTPQLGLLKSTLLQLDSTFSERTYGAGSFRDFAQKLAAAGHVVLREAGRNVLVELADNALVTSAAFDVDELSRQAGPFDKLRAGPFDKLRAGHRGARRRASRIRHPSPPRARRQRRSTATAPPTVSARSAGCSRRRSGNHVGRCTSVS